MFIKKLFLIITLCFLIFRSMLVAGNDTTSYVLLPQYHLSGEIFQANMPTRGSPFFNEAWYRGDVLRASGHWVSDQLLRYNGFLDELLWLPSMVRPQVMLDRGQVKGFIMFTPGRRDTLIFEKIIVRPRFSSQERSIYAQKLYRGKSAVMLHHQIQEDGEYHKRTGRGVFIMQVLKPAPVYYILLPDNQTLLLRKLNNRSFLRLFDEERRELRRSLRENRIRIRTNQDLVKAVRLMDQLFWEYSEEHTMVDDM